MDCPDVLTEGNELVVKRSTGTPTFADVDLVNLESGAILTTPATIAEEPSSIGFPGLTEATYRVVVRPTNAGSSVVSDCSLVLRP